MVFLLSRASFHSIFVNPRILEVKLRAEGLTHLADLQTNKTIYDDIIF